MGEFSNKYIINRSTQDKGHSMSGDLLNSLRERRKERVAEIRDTDSRMPKAQKNKILSLEKGIQKRDAEKGYVVGRNGEILAETPNSGFKIGEGQVSKTAEFNPKDLIRASQIDRDSILTHNHPGFQEKDIYDTFGIKTPLTGAQWQDLAGRVGNTLSPGDLSVAISTGLKGVRAKTYGGYTYSVERRGDSWGVDSSDFEKEYKQLKRQYSIEYQHRTSGDNTLQQTILKGQMGITPSKQDMETTLRYLHRANVAGSHKALKELSKKYGFIYTRHS